MSELKTYPADLHIHSRYSGATLLVTMLPALLIGAIIGDWLGKRRNYMGSIEEVRLRLAARGRGTLESRRDAVNSGLISENVYKKIRKHAKDRE